MKRDTASWMSLVHFMVAERLGKWETLCFEGLGFGSVGKSGCCAGLRT